MFIRNFILWAAFVCFLFGNFSWAEDLVSVDKALLQVFPKSLSYSKQKIILTENQVHRVEEKSGITFEGAHSRALTLYVVWDQKSIIGHAFEDVVNGKWGPIHYLLALDFDGKILQVVILDYEEIRGRPIAKKRFLNQYKGKTLADPLKLKRDIDGITGATISSRSLTDGVRKLLNVFEIISNDKLIKYN